ncbi:MAG: TadE/TadG family type IV pilus assembly protein [Anaerolineae bacterium]
MIELTLALPVLLIMFLGLIELGLAMHAYLVLVNANREGARLGARGVFTDEQIAEQTLGAFGGQLPVDTVGPDANTGIIITRFHIPEIDAEHEAFYYTPIYVTGTMTQTSRINPDVMLTALIDQNDTFNDDLVAAHEDAVRSVHDLVVVEVYYYHNQVLRAPIVEWVFPEPMVLYSRTMMRIGAARTQ